MNVSSIWLAGTRSPDSDRGLMDRGIDTFLGQLPDTTSDQDALSVLATIARRIAEQRGAPVPRSFFQVAEATDPGLLGACDGLEPAFLCPDLLGLAWERLMSRGQKRTHGAHFTPSELANDVVARTLDGRFAKGVPARVWDPAAGGGAFLLAAARAIESRFAADRAEIVRSLHASDLDPLALRVCDAALELWCGGRARPQTCQGDSLLDLPADWPTDFDVVVGNPPFLGQLTSDTARSGQNSARLKERYGALASGYVDQAGLFIECGLNHLGGNGALGFVLPQSLLGSADAEPVRASAQRQAHLVSLWIDDEGTFDASVEVVALVLVATRSTDSPTLNNSPHSSVKVVLGTNDPLEVPAPSSKSWAPLLAAAQGVPAVRVAHHDQVLSDVASTTAGFRQHFYGIADAVQEASGEDMGVAARRGRLMTAGTIDPLAVLWGDRPVKFAGNKWRAPMVVLDRIDDASVRQWFEDRLVPKLLLASQTAVLEVVVDPAGEMVPSVPVVSIEPKDQQMLWHLAAAITSPTVCALLLTQAAGTGLSASAIRVQAKAIGSIPLPAPSMAWDRGAAEAKRAQAAWSADDAIGYTDSLTNLAIAMGEAYGDDGTLVNWWIERLPKRRP